MGGLSTCYLLNFIPKSVSNLNKKGGDVSEKIGTGVEKK